jgi:hypothetical protein
MTISCGGRGLNGHEGRPKPERSGGSAAAAATVAIAAAADAARL